VCRRTGDSRGICLIILRQGDNALHRGELDEAEPVLVSALQAARSLGDPSAQSVARENLGWLALLRGDHGLSAEHLRRALDLAEEVGDPYSVLWILDKFSALATAIKTPHRAAVMLGAAQALARKMQLPYPDDLPVDVRMGSSRPTLVKPSSRGLSRWELRWISMLRSPMPAPTPPPADPTYLGTRGSGCGGDGSASRRLAGRA